MNKTTINKLITYGYCPMLYKYLFVDNIKDTKTSLQEEYNDAFKKTIYNFLSSVSDSVITKASFVNMKATWGRIWIKEKKTIEYIYSDPKTWRDTHNEKRKTGISSLKSFYDYYVHKTFFPVLFNREYTFNIGSIEVSGNFDVVCDNEGKIELLCIKSSGKSFNMMNISKDIEVTSHVYAFRQLFNMVEDDVIVFNSERGSYTSTFRTEKDLIEFETTVKSIYTCIYNNIYYKCPSDKCHRCSCKNMCNK